MGNWSPEPWLLHGHHIYQSCGSKTEPDLRSGNVASMSEPRSPDGIVGYHELKTTSPDFEEALANAARIVSCINALAGIRDPDAWVKAVRELIAMDRHYLMVNGDPKRSAGDLHLQETLAKIAAAEGKEVPDGNKDH